MGKIFRTILKRLLLQFYVTNFVQDIKLHIKTHILDSMRTVYFLNFTQKSIKSANVF